jgi:hypothetical protein
MEIIQCEANKQAIMICGLSLNLPKHPAKKGRPDNFFLFYCRLCIRGGMFFLPLAFVAVQGNSWKRYKWQ